MSAPRSVSKTKFKAHCLALLDEVRKTRRSVLVPRHGKPVVEIRPYGPKDAARVNPLKGSVVFQGDLISPVDEKWESMLSSARG